MFRLIGEVSSHIICYITGKSHISLIFTMLYSTSSSASDNYSRCILLCTDHCVAHAQSYIMCQPFDVVLLLSRLLAVSHSQSNRPLSRRLDRCDRVIQNESRDPFGGNVYYVTMQITFLTRKFRNGERNLHCDIVHITTKWVSSLTLDCNGVFAIKAYGSLPSHCRNSLLECRTLNRMVRSQVIAWLAVGVSHSQSNGSFPSHCRNSLLECRTLNRMVRSQVIAITRCWSVALSIEWFVPKSLP